MKRNVYYMTLFTASFGLLAGCASSRQDGKSISVTPAPYVLAADSENRVRLDMCFHVPENYFSRRSRLVITPQLVVEDMVRDEYVPLVVDAPVYSKKKERMKKLYGYTDPYASRAQRVGKPSRSLDLTYNEIVELPEDVDNARIVAVVSTDGCGECTGMDTVEVAGISNPVTLMPKVKDALKPVWVEPEFVIRPKVLEGKGVANLQFGINRSDIDLSLGDNRMELESMVRTLAPVLTDTLATLNSLAITGMASADGSLALNTALAEKRARSAKESLAEHLDVGVDRKRLIRTGARPEGWQPVLDAMTADGNPDSVAVKNILEKYAESNDDVQEYHIRRLPCWNRIKSKYLQKARKVEYVYAYTMKSFTSDSELLEMYGKRPDAFNIIYDACHDRSDDRCHGDDACHGVYHDGGRRDDIRDACNSYHSARSSSCDGCAPSRRKNCNGMIRGGCPFPAGCGSSHDGGTGCSSRRHHACSDPKSWLFREPDLRVPSSFHMTGNSCPARFPAHYILHIDVPGSLTVPRTHICLRFR